MRQNQSKNHQLETSALYQIRSTEMQDFMPSFPYQFYSPYWNYPFYNYPTYAGEKMGLERCKHCRMVSTTSVTTQTVEQQSQEEQPVERVEEFKINNALRGESMPELMNVKQQQKYDEAVDFKEMDMSPEPSKLSPQKKEKQLFCNKSGTNTMKDDLFQQMLSKYLTSPEEYESLIEEYLKDDSLLSQLVKYFHQKLSTFKKSKQEMIKLIIRKTQRHYKIENNCKRDDRFKKFGGFKSMNSVYLEKLFSDPSFARSYNIVFKTFIEDFEKEGADKLNMFMEKIYSANSYLEFKGAMKVLDEKNKMPWPAFWVEKLRRVAWEIKTNYINDSILDNTTAKKRGAR